MAFDVKKFMKTSFSPREAEVEVPDMKEFFGESEKPIFKVRGLTGPELARVHDAQDKHKDLAGILDAIASNVSEDKIAGIVKTLGLSTDTPAEIVRRLEMFTLGVLEPKVDLDVAVKIADTFPIEFYSVTSKISELTGKGQLPGKPQTSGETPK